MCLTTPCPGGLPGPQPDTLFPPATDRVPMKRILCYGDSLTWGCMPIALRPDGSYIVRRFPAEDRWPDVTAGLLGKDYRVIAEGQNGRTTMRDDPPDTDRNGKDSLLPCLTAHKPLDGVILMLGTNDLKTQFSLTAEEIAGGIRDLVRIILASGSGPGDSAPVILIVSPPLLGEKIIFTGQFDEGLGKSRQLAPAYRKVAEDTGCYFFEAGTVASTSAIDGVHMDAEDQRALGKALAGVVRGMVE